MIRNILFYMGNVLVRFDPKLFVSRLDLPEEDRILLMREVYLHPDWVGCDRGTHTEQEALRKAYERLPERLHEHARHLALEWDDPKDQIPGMEDLCRKLKENGYELYLLTNAGLRHRQYWFKYPVSQYFPEERIFRSADHKTVKPEQQFYDQALEQFGLKREECIFIDDSPANAEGAVHAGLNALVFHGDRDELIAKLRKNGITI